MISPSGARGTPATSCGSPRGATPSMNVGRKPRVWRGGHRRPAHDFVHVDACTGRGRAGEPSSSGHGLGSIHRLYGTARGGSRASGRTLARPFAIRSEGSVWSVSVLQVQGSTRTSFRRRAPEPPGTYAPQAASRRPSHGSRQHRCSFSCAPPTSNV